MKLPKMTAEHLTWYPKRHYPVGNPVRISTSEGLVPNGLDVGALISCGVSVLPCLACGMNPACWLVCAGPGVFNCVKEFLS